VTPGFDTEPGATVVASGREMAEPPASPEQHDGRDAGSRRRRGFVRRHWPKLILSSLVGIVVAGGIGLKLFIDSTHPGRARRLLRRSATPA